MEQLRQEGWGEGEGMAGGLVERETAQKAGRGWVVRESRGGAGRGEAAKEGSVAATKATSMAQTLTLTPIPIGRQCF